MINLFRSMVLLTACLTILLAPAVSSAAPPIKLAFGGNLMSEGHAPSSACFSFAIVDEDQVTSYWSNDGTSGVRLKPDSCVSVDVGSGGEFIVPLGDTSLTNMNSIDASVFNTDEDLYLAVWVQTSGYPTEQLLPNVPLTYSPFSVLVSIASDFITGTHIGDGTIMNADINSSAAIDTFKISGLGTLATTSTVTSSLITDETIVSADILDGTIAAADIAAGAVEAAELSNTNCLQIISSWDSNGSAITTYYYSPYMMRVQSMTESSVIAFHVPTSGVIHTLKALVTTAPGDGKSHIVTVRVCTSTLSCSDTGLECTITGAADKYCEDTGSDTISGPDESSPGSDEAFLHFEWDPESDPAIPGIVYMSFCWGQ